MLSILDADEEKISQQDKLIKKLDDERDQMVQNLSADIQGQYLIAINLTQNISLQHAELQSKYSMLKIAYKIVTKIPLNHKFYRH